MSTENVRNIVHLFEECHTRIQTLGEVLLISCKPRPVFTAPQDLEVTSENFVKYRDRVISHLNKMCILSKDISSQIHSERAVVVEKQLHSPLVSLSSTIVALTQLSAHIAYLMAVNTEGSKPASLGLVLSHFQLVQADLELKFVCARLKRSQEHDLGPPVLVEICSAITKSLSCIADICKDAAEKIADPHEQDQFKLCVKAITSTTSCLVSSVKSFKQHQQQQHHHHHHHHHHQHQHQQSVSSSSSSSSSSSTPPAPAPAMSDSSSHLQRVVNFCQPVTTTSTALTAFAMEDKFLGSPASLSSLGENIYKSVLGLCMSMVSATVQIFKAARDLLHDSTKRKHKDRISLCVESISRTAFRLRDFLLSYDFPSNSTTSATAVVTTINYGGIGGGDDKHLAVIKDGEISTSFQFQGKTASTTGKTSSTTTASTMNDRDRDNDAGRGEIGLGRNTTDDRKHSSSSSSSSVELSLKYNSSSTSSTSSSSKHKNSDVGGFNNYYGGDKKSPSSSSSSNNTTSPLSVSTTYSAGLGGGLQSPHNTPSGAAGATSSSLSKGSLSGSPSSSPKLSSRSSSESKKKHHHHHHHHRKSSSSSSSSKHNLSSGGSHSLSSSPQRNKTSMTTTSSSSSSSRKEITSSSSSHSHKQITTTTDTNQPEQSSSQLSPSSSSQLSPSANAAAAGVGVAAAVSKSKSTAAENPSLLSLQPLTPLTSLTASSAIGSSSLPPLLLPPPSSSTTTSPSNSSSSSPSCSSSCSTAESILSPSSSSSEGMDYNKTMHSLATSNLKEESVLSLHSDGNDL